jgi:hypothetical protein
MLTSPFSPAYKARTSDPKDRCYVGRLASSAPTARRSDTYSLTIKGGTRAWALWALLVRRGTPMTASEIAIHLSCRVKDVSGTAARLVKGEALIARKIGRSCAYSIGTAPVVEV